MSANLTKALLLRYAFDAEGVEIVLAELERLNAKVELGRETETRLNDQINQLTAGLNGAYRQNEALQTKLDEIPVYWITRTVFEKWIALEMYVESHPDAIPGQTTPETALAWLRERDALKSQLAAVNEDRKALKSSLDALGDRTCAPETPKKPPVFVRCIQCHNPGCGPGTGCAQENYYRESGVFKTCDRCPSQWRCRQDRRCHCPPSAHTGGVTAKD